MWRRWPWLAVWWATLAASSGCCSVFNKPTADHIIAARELSSRGVDALQRGDVDRAAVLLAEAVQAAPNDDRARRHYAEALWRQGAHAAAIVEIEAALRLSGEAPELLVQAGHMHLAQGDLARATPLARRAVERQSQSAAAWALWGDVQRAAGQPRPALASYHRSLALDEHQPRVQLAAAEIYQHAGRPARSLATLDALADQFPPGRIPADVTYRQGLALKSLGRPQEAAELIAAAVRQGEPPPDWWYELADAQQQAGDTASARLALRAALARWPDHGPSLELAARLDLPTARR